MARKIISKIKSKKVKSAKVSLAPKVSQLSIFEKLQEHDNRDNMLASQVLLLDEKVDNLDLGLKEVKLDVKDLKMAVGALTTNMAMLNVNMAKSNGVQEKILAVAKSSAWILGIVVSIATAVLKFL